MQPTSSTMVNVIHQYALALINIWEKSFRSKHVMYISFFETAGNSLDITENIAVLYDTKGY